MLFPVRWVGELLRVRTVTGGTAPAAAADGDAAPAPEERAPDGKGAEPTGPGAGGEAAKPEAAGSGDGAAAAPLPVLRGLNIDRTVEKPVLVYFHWPHEDGRRGKEIQKFCNGPLDEEPFGRVSALFHCVEVNTRDSDLRLVAEAKVQSTPTLMVCRTDGTILWRADAPRTSGNTLAATLLRVIQDQFPDRWRKIEEEKRAQQTGLREGRALAAGGRLEDAAFALRNAVNSDVIFTEEWRELRKLLFEVEKKLAEKREQEKGR